MPEAIGFAVSNTLAFQNLDLIKALWEGDQ